MADYKSCAWYQNGKCIRADKSSAPISCSDCEDYDRRVVFKIEDLQGMNEEMSVRKSCCNCKHNNIGICHFGNVIGGMPCKTTAMEYWELADDAKAEALHDAEPEHDAVNSPSHYTSGGIECIDCIKAALGKNFIGFLIGNVIKYTYRYKDKNGVTDLEKASVYLKWAIEEMKKNG